MDLQNHSPDRSAACDQAVESCASKESASIVQIDPKASAALALAINGAKQGAKSIAAVTSAASPTIDSATTNIVPGKQSSGRSYVAQAAIALIMIGSCWFGSYTGTLSSRDSVQNVGNEAARSQEALNRLNGEIEALKTTFASLKDAMGTASEASAADQAKLAETIERQLTHLALALPNPDAKLSTLETRLDRMENQIMAALASMAAKPAAPALTEAAANPPAKPGAATVTDVANRDAAPAVKPAKSEPIDGWVVREVYDGVALVEGQNRRVYEAVPGGFVPGIGRVEAIERRGRSWVVLTDKGVIGAYR